MELTTKVVQHAFIDRINLVQDTDQKGAVVYKVMHLLDP